MDVVVWGVCGREMPRADDVDDDEDEDEVGLGGSLSRWLSRVRGGVTVAVLVSSADVEGPPSPLETVCAERCVAICDRVS